MSRIRAKQQAVDRWVATLETERSRGATWADQLRRELDPADLPPAFRGESAEVREEVIYRVRYRGYLEREARIIERLAGLDRVRIPDGIDFNAVRGLRREAAQKLSQQRPVNLGQAGRISGVSPADLSILLVWIESARSRPGGSSGAGGTVSGA